MGKKSLDQRKIMKVLFVVYLAAVTWIILFKFQMPWEIWNTGRGINLIPFHDSLVINGRVDLSEIIMNAVIFVPFGIYLSGLFDSWGFWKKFFVFTGVSLLYEVLQFIFAIGRTDITDLIENSLGGIIGVLLYALLHKICKKEGLTNRIVNILAGVGTVSMIALLGLILIVNM